MSRYIVAVYKAEGEFVTDIGPFAVMSSARQAMLDYAGVVDLPIEEPFHAPALGILEGWFIGRTEYQIRHVGQCLAKTVQGSRAVA